ncbi:unnamed protein product [Lepidochelys olivacea]
MEAAGGGGPGPGVGQTAPGELEWGGPPAPDLRLGAKPWVLGRQPGPQGAAAPPVSAAMGSVGCCSVVCAGHSSPRGPAPAPSPGAPQARASPCRAQAAPPSALPRRGRVALGEPLPGPLCTRRGSPGPGRAGPGAPCRARAAQAPPRAGGCGRPAAPCPSPWAPAARSPAGALPRARLSADPRGSPQRGRARGPGEGQPMAGAGGLWPGPAARRGGAAPVTRAGRGLGGEGAGLGPPGWGTGSGEPAPGGGEAGPVAGGWNLLTRQPGAGGTRGGSEPAPRTLLLWRGCTRALGEIGEPCPVPLGQSGAELGVLLAGTLHLTLQAGESGDCGVDMGIGCALASRCLYRGTGAASDGAGPGL